MLIDYILSKEITDEKGALGGFALGGNVPDPDITGMALQALAPYQNQEKVAQAIQRAIEVLSNLQENTGEYGSWGAKGAESTVQVIVGLSLLGIDCQTDQRFTKTDEAGKQHTPISAIMAYKASGGGFEHIKGQGINGMVTEQALYGLVAYERFQQGKTSLYDMTDVKGTVPAAPTATKAKESETANPTGQTADLAFTDIANHWAKDKIEALKGLGITNGQNTFAPDKAITRAEFAVALVNAFGLEKKDGAMVSFTDIPGNAWFQGAVLAAASQGIIKGKGNGLFEPQANITREEAMIMIQNIATTVYSMQNTTDEGVLLNEFADAGQISPWAKEAVVFNISQGIVVGEEQTINPSRPLSLIHISYIGVAAGKIERKRNGSGC